MKSRFFASPWRLEVENWQMGRLLGPKPWIVNQVFPLLTWECGPVVTNFANFLWWLRDSTQPFGAGKIGGFVEDLLNLPRCRLNISCHQRKSNASRCNDALVRVEAAVNFFCTFGNAVLEGRIVINALTPELYHDMISPATSLFFSSEILLVALSKWGKSGGILWSHCPSKIVSSLNDASLRRRIGLPNTMPDLLIHLPDALIVSGGRSRYSNLFQRLVKAARYRGVSEVKEGI